MINRIVKTRRYQMENLLLKPAEVAEILRIGRSLVYVLLSTGEIPSIRLGKCIRVPKASLEKWMVEHETVKPKKEEQMTVL
jgi:excisionase family DNA binding protein